MNTIIWILIVTTNSHSGALVVRDFTEENACLSFVATMERKSKDKPGMHELYGICVPVPLNKILKN